MTARSWIRTLLASLRPGARRKAACPCRPSLEALEDRALPSVAFDPPVRYRAGGTPNSVAVGDFNGDGRQDLAVTNFSSTNVSVRLGNGDGTFQKAFLFDAGAVARSLAVGDFNGDGRQDLATANYNSNNVSVLLGNGDGSFHSAVNYEAGAAPTSVAVGDFDGDGRQDLATANFFGNSVSILLGQGDGTFHSAVTFGTVIGAISLAVGDFDGDGRQDLATANGSVAVSVLRGQGDGSFHSAVNYDVGSFPYSVAAGDFDGDGRQDLATASYVSNTVSVLLGRGDGTFQGAVPLGQGGASPSAVTIGVGKRPSSVAVGDFNGDGRPDLATANNVSNDVSVLLQARGISVALVKRQVGPRMKLFVQVSHADSGELKSELRSPFQRPAFRKIVATDIDRNGDGFTDAVKLTAREVTTNRLVRRILPA